MPLNPPADTQRLTPGLAYADAPAAIEFLCGAFGFEELSRFAMPDGRIGHAALGFKGQTLFTLASEYEELGFTSPRSSESAPAQNYCYVDDVDAHYARARAAGATIIGEPEDQFYGDRSYRAVDPEGHRWIFATRVRDVAPEDMKPPE